MIRDIEGMVARICAEIRRFTDIAVVGMSGGADSSAVATLCMLALGKDNVYSVHMPYNRLDLKTFNNRSVKLAEKLGVKKSMVSIAPIADAIEAVVSAAIDEGVVSTLNKGNARSRARMVTLYGISSHLHETMPGKRIRVVGTGNLSEDFIGYDTKGGDALCDIFPIGELFKSEVYQLLEYFRNQGLIDEEHIDRVPSAGLWDGQTDEDELGYTYNEMEPVIKAFLRGDQSVYDLNAYSTSGIISFVANRHLRNKHKHEAPPVIKLREEFCG